MARTVSEIYNAIVTEKETASSLTGLDPNAGETAANLLSDLTAGSRVAIWRLIFWVTAFAIHTHEVLQDTYLEQLEQRAKSFISGTPLYYQDRALTFQYGDSLTWNGSQYIYDPVVPANQIIKRAAITDEGGLVKVKVAKLSGSSPVPLSTAEKSAFDAYMGLVKFAGIPLQVISASADTARIYYTIQVDPLVLDPSTGESIATPGSYPVEDAITAFIADLPFNGVLNITSLTDSIQAVSGVVDPIFGSLDARPAGVTAWSSVSANYTPLAGYIEIDGSFALSTTLTYTS